MTMTLSSFLTFCTLARGARLWDSSKDPLASPSGTNHNGEIICGSLEIWKILTKSSSARDLNWERIASVADDFITTKRSEEEALSRELKNLQERITEKEKMEEPELSTREELQQLIEKSLHAFEDSKMTNAESANRTRCGKPCIEEKNEPWWPNAPRGAFKESKIAFKDNADVFFDKNKRLNGTLFLEVCNDLLPTPADDKLGQTSYCGSLCKNFSGVATALSSKRAGEIGGRLSKELVKELLAKQMHLSGVQGAIKGCNLVKENIRGVQREVGELVEQSDEAFEEYTEAEEALADAQAALKTVFNKLDEQLLQLEGVEQALSGNEAEVNKLKSSISEAKENLAGLQEKLRAVSEVLASLEKEVSAAQKALEISVNFKLALDTVMEKMWQFFREAALEPLSDVGLSGSCKAQDYFKHKDDVVETEFRRSVDSLAAYCEEKALDVFKQVDSVDLVSLCKFGEPGNVTSEVLNAVNAKEQMFVHELEQILKGHDRYNSPGLDSTTAEELVAKGERRSFLTVISVYSDTRFFKVYLRKWRKGGEFESLLRALKDLFKKLEEDRNTVEADLEQSQEAISKGNEKLEELVKECMVAKEDLTRSEEEQKRFAEAVEQLQGEGEAKKVDITELLERVRKAMEKNAQLDKGLRGIYEKLKSDLSKRENALLEKMHRVQRLAGDKLASMRQWATDSESSLLAAQETITEGGARALG